MSSTTKKEKTITHRQSHPKNDEPSEKPHDKNATKVHQTKTEHEENERAPKRRERRKPHEVVDAELLQAAVPDAAEQAYCIKCRRVQPIASVIVGSDTRGRARREVVCSVCGTKNYRFTKK